jgi:1-pyrroline-5-carboxylate dehydrogenase
MAQKITYVTSADRMDEIHREFGDAVERVRARFGDAHPMLINGQPVASSRTFTDVSPIDTRIVLGHFQEGERTHVDQAVHAARGAFGAWSRQPWRERLAQMRRLAEAVRGDRWDLAALMGFECGKNRMECLGDVEESADLIDYYCDQIELGDGFVRAMRPLGPAEQNSSVLRPYGVWAVISPFNFPLALAAGPAGAALAAGNTVVIKPATTTPWIALRFGELARDAGLPHGVLNIVTGGGATVGQALIDHADVDGVVFTGSKAVGLKLLRDNAGRPIPRPVITEMGGKNPAIVMPSADLDVASDGVMRSAFGAQGQKCSACSRILVHRDVRARFVEALVAKTKGIRIGNPLDRDVYLGPVINEAAVKTFESAVTRATADGARLLAGGGRITDEPFGHGYYVEPTIVDGLTIRHAIFKDELFVPVTAIATISTLEEAIAIANTTEYGLTAGIFSQDAGEVDAFFERIDAGVTYANRRAGATTGAWPGVNPFGGWKCSGSSGKGSGGPYYVQQFLREQSRVRA